MTISSTVGDYRIRKQPGNADVIEIFHPPTGRRLEFDQGRLNGIQLVNSAKDLPEAQSGVRTLDSSAKGYWFLDFVVDPATLDPNGIPMVGFHGASGGYIHTGGTTAFQSSKEFMVDNFYGHAPGGTLFDLSADGSTEMYVTDSAFFDPPDVGLGNMASLGTVDGYRVQTFKRVNLESADDGITFTGPTNKTIIEGSPIRNVGVQGNGTKLVTFDANYGGSLAKLSGDDYIKFVPTDAELVHVESGGEPSSYLAIQNTDVQESDIDESNVVTGALDEKSVGVIIENVKPLSDSMVVGELVIDSSTTQTGTATGAAINDGSYTLSRSERTSSPNPGELQYDARYNSNCEVAVEVSVSGDNTTFEVSIRRNGTIIETRSSSTSSASKPTSVRVTKAVEDVTSDTPDVFDAYLNNTGGSSDLTTEFFELRVKED